MSSVSFTSSFPYLKCYTMLITYWPIPFSSSSRTSSYIPSSTNAPGSSSSRSVNPRWFSTLKTRLHTPIRPKCPSPPQSAARINAYKRTPTSDLPFCPKRGKKYIVLPMPSNLSSWPYLIRPVAQRTNESRSKTLDSKRCTMKRSNKVPLINGAHFVDQDRPCLTLSQFPTTYDSLTYFHSLLPAEWRCLQVAVMDRRRQPLAIKQSSHFWSSYLGMHIINIIAQIWWLWLYKDSNSEPPGLQVRDYIPRYMSFLWTNIIGKGGIL